MLALRHVAAAIHECEPTMSNENSAIDSSADLQDDDFESIGQYHRMAAHHFSAAAKHHLAAALADDEGEEDAAARHAHLAYRHQLNGMQYAEVAVMDSDSLEDEFSEMDVPEAEEV